MDELKTKLKALFQEGALSEKDYTNSIAYHLEVCDECICECPVKLDEWKKRGDFGRMIIQTPDDCNCFQNDKDKKEHFKKLGVIIK